MSSASSITCVVNIKDLNYVRLKKTSRKAVSDENYLQLEPVQTIKLDDVLKINKLRNMSSE